MVFIDFSPRAFSSVHALYISRDHIYDDNILSLNIIINYKYKKQLQKIEKEVEMEYQKAYKQG